MFKFEIVMSPADMLYLRYTSACKSTAYAGGFIVADTVLSAQLLQLAG